MHKGAEQVYNRTLIHVDITQQVASLACEKCGLEDEVGIGDDLEDGLSLAAICRHIREEHASMCDRLVDREMEDIMRVFGGRG